DRQGELLDPSMNLVLAEQRDDRLTLHAHLRHPLAARGSHAARLRTMHHHVSPWRCPFLEIDWKSLVLASKVVSACARLAYRLAPTITRGTTTRPADGAGSGPSAGRCEPLPVKQLHQRPEVAETDL